MDDIRIILSFVIPLIVIFFMIQKKSDTVFFLMIGAILSGIIAGLPLTTILSTIKSGLGSVLSQVGLLVLFGMIFSEFLESSGGIGCLAKFISERTSTKGSIVAIYALGYVISIPVNFTAATTMMAPLIRRLSDNTRNSTPSYACAFSVASFLTNCLVVPTLTPALLAGIAGIDLGPFMVMGIMISLVTSLAAALGGAFILAKRYGSIQPVENPPREAISTETEPADHPAVKVVVALILLPIILILLGTFVPSLLPAGSPAFDITSFIGDPVGALFLSIIVEMIVLRKHLNHRPMPVFTSGLRHAGGLLIVLGTANSFGSVLSAGGSGDVILRLLSGTSIPVLLLAFLMVAILHAGTGVMTVAATASLPLLMPLVKSAGGSMTLLVLACCLGCVALVLPNSTEFFIFRDAYGMSVRDTIISISIPATIAGIVGILCLMVFNAIVPLPF